MIICKLMIYIVAKFMLSHNKQTPQNVFDRPCQVFVSNITSWLKEPSIFVSSFRLCYQTEVSWL